MLSNSSSDIRVKLNNESNDSERLASHALVCVVEPWVVLSQLFSLLLSQTLDPMILLTSHLSLVLVAEEGPER